MLLLPMLLLLLPHTLLRARKPWRPSLSSCCSSPPPAALSAAAILDEQLQGVDLQADMEAVLAEDHVLAAALQAAAEVEAAEAAGAVAAAAAATSGMSREQQARAEAARARQEGEGIALLDEDMEDEPEVLPGVASFLLINSKRGGSERGPVSVGAAPDPAGPLCAGSWWLAGELCAAHPAFVEHRPPAVCCRPRACLLLPPSHPAACCLLCLQGEDGVEEEEEGGRVAVPLAPEAGSPGGGSSGHSPRNRGHHGTWAGMSKQQLQQVAQDRAANRARSRLRFAVFRQHLDLDSWYEVRAALRCAVPRCAGIHAVLVAVLACMHAALHGKRRMPRWHRPSMQCWPTGACSLQPLILPPHPHLFPPLFHALCPAPPPCRRCTCSKRCWTRA